MLNRSSLLVSLCRCACWVILLLGACGEQGAFLYVQITNVPTSTTPQSVIVYTLLDHVPANEEIRLPLPAQDSVTLGLRLAGPLSGNLIINVGVLDEQGCLVTTGNGFSMLQPIDQYREIKVALEGRAVQTCHPEDPTLASVQPTQISTTGRSDPATAVPLVLSGWGFRPGMQVFIGNQLQPAPRVLSFRDAIVDLPQVAHQLGATRVTLKLPDHPSAVLENALTVTLASVGTTLVIPAKPATTNPVLDLAVGDFDHNGRPEIALLDTKAVIWFYGYQEPGSPMAKPALVAKPASVMLAASGITMPSSGSLVSGDLDRDGADDLVVVTPMGSAVIKGQAGGTFSVVQSAPGLQGLDAALADMDGDGLLDLVRVGDEIAVHRNVGDGTFATTPSLRVATGAGAVRVADMDGDGRPDLIALSASGEVLVLINEKEMLSTRLRYPVLAGCPGYAASLVVADLDDDGKPDVLVNGLAAIFLDPAGSVHLTYIDGVPPCFGGLAVGAADLNGDGQTDLAWLRSGSLVMFPRAGFARLYSQFSSTAITPSLGTGPRHLPAADINGDGTSDLIVGHGVLLTTPQ